MTDLRKTPLRRLLLLSAIMGGASLVEDTATGNPVIFETDVSKPLVSLLIPFTPVQSGTGDPSPENIRPIVPWNGLNVNNAGKNVVDIVGFSAQDVNGIDINNFSLTNSYGTTISTKEFSAPDTELVITQANSSTDYAKDNYRNGYFAIIPSNLLFNKKYTISFKVTDIVNNPLNVSLGDLKVIRPNGSTGTLVSVSGDTVTFNFENTQNPNYPTRRCIDIRICGMSCTISEILITAENVTDRTFEPYEGHETDISFPSPVYGGTPDIISGRMLVEWAEIASYNGETLPGEWMSDRDVYSAGTTPTIGAQVVYKLATPQEITLTPQQITALLGDNTIWSDADGQMTAVYLKKA